VKTELERVEIPGEHEARGRTWAVVSASFAERQPVEKRGKMWRPAVAIAIVVAAAAAVLSSPGRAVLDELREVVGVERAQPALFSLPTEGRLLVSSDAGIWVVQQDGSKRLLGPYREASWSPFGRYVVATRANELAALEPDGDVRWTLARPEVRSPHWGGTETDTRIAYVDRAGLRVVAGDGSGDRLLVRGFQGLAAWDPDEQFVLALADARGVRLMDLSSGRTLWRRTGPGATPLDVAWSTNGQRLLVASRRGIAVFDPRGNRLLDLEPGAAATLGAALSPAGSKLVFAQRAAARTQLWIVPRIRPDANAARRLFSARGILAPEAWSPDGQWVAVTWPEADQWVFLRANGSGIRAVANVSEQFRSRTFPRVEGWCCAPQLS
jgi:hypothetical protein